MEMVSKLGERIYSAEPGKKIIEMAKDPDSTIVDKDKQNGGRGGLLPHREVENFLNDVETTFLLKQQGILTDDIFKRSFRGWLTWW